MQSSNGRILLSPSDLNDYVNCRAPTTLAREVARGEREAPHVADEGAKLLRKRASCTSSISWSACTTKVATSSRSRWTSAGTSTPPRPARSRRCAPAPTSSRRRRSSTAHGAAAPTSCSEVAGAVEARPLELRSARREARSRREADLRAPALLLQRRHRQRSGRRARAHARAPRHRRASARFATTISPPITGACERGSKRPLTSPARNRALSGRALRAVRVPWRVQGSVARRRQPRAGRGSAPRASRAAARRRPADAEGTRAGAARNDGAADRAALVRNAARPGGAAARTAHVRTAGLASHRRRQRAAASSCCRGRRPAT